MKNIRRSYLLIVVITMSLLVCLFAEWVLAQDVPPKQQRGNKNRPPKTASENPSGNQKQTGQRPDTSAQGNRLPWVEPFSPTELLLGSELLGRPTDRSVTLNIVPQQALEIFVEYGTASGVYTAQTNALTIAARTPTEIMLDGLQPDTRYYYRLRYRTPGAAEFQARDEVVLHTQRAPGSTFTFDIQGDSHPERNHQNDPELYRRTLLNAAADQPDFYLTIGDDFSIDTLKTVTIEAIDQIYLNQRRFLGLVGKNAPVFLVNGNHEQAAGYLLDGTPNNPAVWVQNTRNRYFPQPAPDDFYTGNAQPVEHIGLLRDYYAWTWGNVLFVVIDPYWHSPVPSDNRLGSGDKTRDLWDITLGDAQYQWLKTTLEQSNTTFKFVFTHQVLGTGRGGIDLADYYEWGGKSRNGVWEFDQKRPGWELPIHQLLVKTGVTIFFHGHDHVFVQQERDGVVYQELPEPADPAYTLYNADAYKTGVKLPNSGHVRVTVSASEVKVAYIRAWLPKDEKDGHTNGEVAYSYTIKAK
jgi:hypothetical protein